MSYTYRNLALELKVFVSSFSYTPAANLIKIFSLSALSALLSFFYDKPACIIYSNYYTFRLVNFYEIDNIMQLLPLLFLQVLFLGFFTAQSSPILVDALELILKKSIVKRY